MNRGFPKRGGGCPTFWKNSQACIFFLRASLIRGIREKLWDIYKILVNSTDIFYRKSTTHHRICLFGTFCRTCLRWSCARGCCGPSCGNTLSGCSRSQQLWKMVCSWRHSSPNCSRSVHNCVTNWLTVLYKFVLTNWYAYMGVNGAIVARLANLHLWKHVKDCHKPR